MVPIPSAKLNYHAELRADDEQPRAVPVGQHPTGERADSVQPVADGDGGSECRRRHRKLQQPNNDEDRYRKLERVEGPVRET